MASDAVYELCLPILEDTTIEEEEKTERLEELLKKQTALTGHSLENAILDALWRFREAAAPSTSPPPMRHTIVRRPSPAPWQIARASTPLFSSSPAPPSGFGAAPPAFTLAKSSSASPFTSPRPSPRLAFTSPRIPHSPNLNAYEFPTETTPAPDIYGDYGSDTVDWLVNDETNSNASSSMDMGLWTSYVQPQQVEMSPYDMLRSVLGEGRSDEEIERALEMNGYDLSATIMALMEIKGLDSGSVQSGTPEGAILVGKSMSPNPPRPLTPSTQGQGRSGVVCRFWLSTGTCLRADCRFSHDLSNHICKYWVMGNCLAGDTCIFSHDPSNMVNRLTLDDNSASPPASNVQPNFQLQDLNSFPSLQSVAADQYANTMGYQNIYGGGSGLVAPSASYKGLQNFAGDLSSYRSHSRPTSRHQSRPPTPSVPPVDDTEAFPSLGAAASGKGGKKHHGKRGGHGHGHKDGKENNSGSLADIVRMTPSPSPGQNLRKSQKAGKTSTGGNRAENSTAAQAIPAPQHVPWLETGDKVNKLYLKARNEAIKHGGLRNKFLQSAAQAWNRNDARAAKALSLRGQSENDLMRKAHREAARELYEERNKDPNSGELYVDLHAQGLHPEEAVEYLERVLLEQQASTRPVYAITGTGHHSKNGKDKVGKAIRGFLNEWRYAYREFSVPGDRNNVGGILGVDPRSYDKSLASAGTSNDSKASNGILLGDSESAGSGSPVPANVKLAKGQGKKS
ncbi:hypothetical protein GP486_005916 [Trichoglossum hirsutum]|uniref:CCCH zinc finger and SMR domain-containing protein n=1 Tax=Trichoglossum hirsutum TaxID=265104 RepID=A0A9P8L8B8_9PEZI|nr:hypothetical protein GP486_005916 [Trichoglossum hirsutum]